MNLHYEGAVETLEELGISSPKSYLERALKVYNFNRFPESGLNDEATGKIMKTAVDIAHADERLVQKKFKTDYSLNPKEKVSGDLGTQILREELGKVGRGIGKVTKELGDYTLGINFAMIPTIKKAVYDKDGNPKGPFKMAGLAISSYGLNTFTYFYLLHHNPKLIPYIAIPQIAANIASGIYEWRRMKKKKQTEAEEESINIMFLGKQTPPKPYLPKGEIEKNAIMIVVYATIGIVLFYGSNQYS